MDIEIISILIITCLAVISPGPDFAMTLRNSIRYGRGSGLMTALGIASGVSVHLTYTVLGLTYFLVENTWLLEMMKYIGAAYLAWIGVSSLLLSRKGEQQKQSTDKGYLRITKIAAFRYGFLCNALNPKTALFFMALFTQVASPTMSVPIQLALGAFIALAHFTWFACVALALTHNQFEGVIVKGKHIIEKITGACLLGLSLKLLFVGGQLD